MESRKILVGMIAMAGIAFAQSASAGLVLQSSGFISGNDCVGGLGGPPETDCSINGSPLIAKFDWVDPDEGGPGAGSWVFSSSKYATIDGSEFTITPNNVALEDGDGPSSGTFAYDPSPYNGPGLRYWSLKYGTGYQYFWYQNEGEASDFTKAVVLAFGQVVNWSTGGKGLSHITFYDTKSPGDEQLVPIPAAAWLLGSGLLGLFAVGRRRKVGQVAAA